MREDTERFSEAFAALGDETRVAILEALVDARVETPDDPGLSFSELRERVGVTDSGRFNYHLGKLRDRFVEEVDGEYTLTYAGAEVVGAILSGTPDPDLVLDPVVLDATCPLCDAPLTAGYDNGTVRVGCENDHTPLQTTVPPSAAADRSMTDLLDVTARETYAKLELATAGICWECFGRMDHFVEPFDEYTDLDYAFRTICSRCGSTTTSALGITVLRHPAFVSFCHDHGLDVRELLPWQLPGLNEGDAERIAEDPDRYRVTVQIDDETLGFTLDEHGAVVDHDRSMETEIPT